MATRKQRRATGRTKERRSLDGIVRRLRRLAKEMRSTGNAMRRYRTHSMYDHGTEMVGASDLCAQWAEHIINYPPNAAGERPLPAKGDA